jgi:hypothetical protein
LAALLLLLLLLPRQLANGLAVEAASVESCRRFSLVGVQIAVIASTLLLPSESIQHASGKVVLDIPNLTSESR